MLKFLVRKNYVELFIVIVSDHQIKSLRNSFYITLTVVFVFVFGIAPLFQQKNDIIFLILFKDEKLQLGIMYANFVLFGCFLILRVMWKTTSD